MRLSGTLSHSGGGARTSWMQWKVPSKLDDITTKPLIPFSSSTREELTHSNMRSYSNKSVVFTHFYCKSSCRCFLVRGERSDMALQNQRAGWLGESCGCQDISMKLNISPLAVVAPPENQRFIPSFVSRLNTLVQLVNPPQLGRHIGAGSDLANRPDAINSLP